jgi:hypothetical protein
MWDEITRKERKKLTNEFEPAWIRIGHGIWDCGNMDP